MKKQGKIAILFLLPYLLIFLLFRVLPSLGGLAVSFFNWRLGGVPRYVRLDNYTKLFRDPMFWISLLNTAKLFLLTVPPLLVLSLLLAILLNGRFKGRKLVRTFSIVPYVLIPSIVGIMWKWLYDNNFGLLNYYIKLLGGKATFWLTDQNVVLFSIALVVIWTYIGYNMILFLAGLQGINTELYEAAYIDGANRVQAFFRVTLPLLKPVLMMVLTLTMVNVVQLFDLINVMTNGGPGTSTLTMVQYMYTSAFTHYEIGYGAAIQVCILLILLILIVLQNRLLKRKVPGKGGQRR